MAERPHRHPAVWWSRNKLRWPFLVWAVAIAASCYLYSKGIRFAVITGSVEAEEELVAPFETGLLREIRVEPGQEVAEGETLAIMDTTTIDQDMQVFRLQNMEELSGVANFQETILSLHRQFQSDISSAESSLLNEKRALAEAKAELVVLNTEEYRLRKLMDQGLSGGGDLDALGMIVARKASMKVSVKLYPESIKSVETSLKRMATQLNTLNEYLRVSGDETTPGSALLDDMVKRRKEVHSKQLERLNLRRDRATLRASRDGTVSRVMVQQGSVVAAGSPVLTVVQRHSTRVIAFLPEGQAARLSPGTPTIIERRNKDRQRYEAVVLALGPEIYALPNRISPIRTQTVRGRRVIIDVMNTKNELIPGETISIYLSTNKDSIISRLLAAIFGDKKATKTDSPDRVEPQSEE